MKYFGTDGIRGKYGDFEIREPFFRRWVSPRRSLSARMAAEKS